MLETLRTILLDFQETPLETGFPRRLRIETVPGKATVCIGVRRCGKSTYLFQRIERILAQGVPKENILYLNFFDDRLHPLRHEGLGRVTEAYYSLYPEKKGAEIVYCFFDEIQAVEGWEAFVDRILRTERCEVYLTGSSARMLSKEIATQMRGRALSWELFPFSFREFLDFKGIDASGPLSTRRRLQAQKAFEEYWETGGCISGTLLRLQRFRGVGGAGMMHVSSCQGSVKPRQAMVGRLRYSRASVGSYLGVATSTANRQGGSTASSPLVERLRRPRRNELHGCTYVPLLPCPSPSGTVVAFEKFLRARSLTDSICSGRVMVTAFCGHRKGCPCRIPGSGSRDRAMAPRIRDVWVGGQGVLTGA